MATLSFVFDPDTAIAAASAVSAVAARSTAWDAAGVTVGSSSGAWSAAVAKIAASSAAWASLVLQAANAESNFATSSAAWSAAVVSAAAAKARLSSVIFSDPGSGSHVVENIVIESGGDIHYRYSSNAVA